MPMIPIAFSCVAGLISMAVVSRFKYKNFFRLRFYLCFGDSDVDFCAHGEYKLRILIVMPVAAIGDKVSGLL